MTKLPHITVAIAAFATFSPALAQPANLPDGPITRTEVIAGAKRQFAAMDANHDGTISRAEFDAYRAAQEAGRTADAGLFSHVGSHWFDKADFNGDGRVTPEEAAARPLQMFDMADANHDGTVSPAERRIALMMMSLSGK